MASIKIEPTPEIYKESSYICPICWDIAVEPVKNPCGHYVCFKCSGYLFKIGNPSCATCKHDYDKEYTPEVERKKINLHEERGKK